MSAALLSHPAAPWLLGVVCALSLTGVLASARELGVTRTVLAAMVAGTGWVVTCLTVLGPRLPVAWINPIREGFTESHVEAVFGFGVHAGALHRALLAPALLGPDAGLRQVVALGLGWWGAALVGTSLLAGHIAGHRLAGVALAAGVYLSPHGLWLATGETSAPLVAVLGLLGVLPFRVWQDPARTRRAAAASAGTLALLTGLVALARMEVAVLGVAALVGGWLSRTGRAQDARDRWAEGVDRAWAFARRQPMAASLVVVAWAAVCERLLPSPVVDMRWLGQWTWAALALVPFQVRTLTLPLLLLACLPVGLVALAGLGSVGALRRPAEHAFLPVVLLLLYGSYYLAGHGGLWGQHRPVSGWELLRYAMLLTPWIAVLAALGWARLAPQLPGWGAPALLVACLLPPWSGAMGLLLPVERGDPRAEAWPSRWQPLSQTAQAEERALLSRIETEPGCGVVTWGHTWGGKPTPENAHWLGARPTGRAGHLRRADLPPDAPIAAVLTALGMDDMPCVVAWQGMDCALDGAQTCTTLQGLPALAVEVLPARPFVHPAHGRLTPGTLTMGWRSIPGRAATSPTP